MKTKDVGISMLGGLRYILNATVFGGNTIYIAAAVVFAAISPRSFSSGEKLALGSVASFLIYVAWTGGDFFPNGRFLLAVTPFTMIVVARKIVEAASSSRDRLARPAPLVGIGTFSMLIVLQSVAPPVRAAGNSEIEGPITLRHANQLPSPPGSGFATIQLIKTRLDPRDGSIGMFYIGHGSYYLSKFHITDFLGKADPYIAHLPAQPSAPRAHNKWDFDYSLNRRPPLAIVVDVPPPGNEAAARSAVERKTGHWYVQALSLNKTLHERFTYLTHADFNIGTGAGFYLRKDLVGKFCGAMTEDARKRHCA